jgi:hypothetical protein
MLNKKEIQREVVDDLEKVINKLYETFYEDAAVHSKLQYLVHQLDNIKEEIIKGLN